MNENYKAITEAGYKLEVTTTKYGEGYMHVLEGSERVIRIHIMTNNRTGKVIMASLPKAKPGTLMDIAMGDLREVAISRKNRNERKQVNAFLDADIGRRFSRDGSDDFWSMASRAQMFKYASDYSATYDISKRMPIEAHLNKFHEFAYHNLANKLHDNSLTNLAGIASTINKKLN